MMDAVTDDEAGDPKRDGDLVSAEKFAGLVEAAGGATAAARILKRSRNAVEKWATGKSRLPFDDVLALALAVDGNLNRFALGADDEAVTSAEGWTGPVIGGPPPAGYVALPLLDVTASAGSGSFALGGPSGSIAARESWLRTIGAHPTRTEALTARGDSMEPTIRDGDLLLVDRSIDSIMDDAVYVVTVFGAVKVKRVTRRTDGAVVLSSDNPRHPPETVPRSEVEDVLTIEGRVRWCGRLM